MGSPIKEYDNPGIWREFTNLAANVEGILKDIAQEHNLTWAQPIGIIENIQAFGSAVDWSERWIQGIFAFHAVLATTAFLTRKHFKFQIGLFFFVCILIMVSEPLNGWLSTRWQLFSQQVLPRITYALALSPTIV
eukprot:367235_1